MEEEIVIVFPRDVSKWDLFKGIEEHLIEKYNRKVFIKRTFNLKRRKKRLEE